jgi:hypothetical protein
MRNRLANSRKRLYCCVILHKLTRLLSLVFRLAQRCASASIDGNKVTSAIEIFQNKPTARVFPLATKKAFSRAFCESSSSLLGHGECVGVKTFRGDKFCPTFNKEGNCHSQVCHQLWSISCSKVLGSFAGSCTDPAGEPLD